VRDWERLPGSGRYNMKQLKEAMLLLIANDGPLGPEWSDHPLKGNWAGYRECHIGGDFLLIYRLDGSGSNEMAGHRVCVSADGFRLHEAVARRYRSLTQIRIFRNIRTQEAP